MIWVVRDGVRHSRVETLNVKRRPEETFLEHVRHIARDAADTVASRMAFAFM